MKTAISIPDSIFIVADRMALRLGMSRSELYVTALRNFLEKHHTGRITEKLNALYHQESSALDANLKNMQKRSLPKDVW